MDQVENLVATSKARQHRKRIERIIDMPTLPMNELATGTDQVMEKQIQATQLYFKGSLQ